MNDLLVKCFKEAIWGSWLRISLTILDVVACIFIITGKCIIDVFESWELWLSCGLFIIIFVSLLSSFIKNVSKEITMLQTNLVTNENTIRELSKKLEKDYLYFFSLLSIPYAAMHTILRPSKINEKELMKAMIHFCSQLKKAFEHINNQKSSYSISIKLATKSVKLVDRDHFNDIELTNAFRDPDSESNLNRKDDVYNATPHRVVDNTAYKSIVDALLLSSNSYYYVNNNVGQTKNYKSSSKDCYDDGKLPYESELVLPIIPLKDRRESTYLIGMLCITSDKIDGFKMEEIEYRIMAALSDGLYNILSKWHLENIQKAEVAEKIPEDGI